MVVYHTVLSLILNVQPVNYAAKMLLRLFWQISSHHNSKHISILLWMIGVVLSMFIALACGRQAAVAIAVITAMLLLLTKHKTMVLSLLFGSCIAIIHLSSEAMFYAAQPSYQPHVVTGKLLKVSATATATRVDIAVAQQQVTQRQTVPGCTLRGYIDDRHLATSVQLIPGIEYQWQAARVYPIRSQQNFGGFDYLRWLKQQQICRTANISSWQPAAPAQTLYAASMRRIAIWKSALRDSLGNSEFFGIYYALITGDRSYIQDNQWAVLRDTATVHMVVVSGLHLAMVFAIGFFITKAILAPIRIYWHALLLQQLPWCIGLLLASGYAYQAGWGIATQRAWVMLSAASVIYALQRPQPVWQYWLFALFITLCITPLAVFDSGFWFSFTAVIGLIGAHRWHTKHKFRVVQWLFAAQIVISIVLTPLLAGYYGWVNLASMVANVVLVPALSIFILPMLLAAALLVALQFSVTAQMLIAWLDVGFAYVWQFLTVIAQLDIARFNLPHMLHYSYIELLFIAIGSLAVLLPNAIFGLPRVRYLPMRMVLLALVCSLVFVGRTASDTTLVMASPTEPLVLFNSGKFIYILGNVAALQHRSITYRQLQENIHFIGGNMPTQQAALRAIQQMPCPIYALQAAPLPTIVSSYATGCVIATPQALVQLGSMKNIHKILTTRQAAVFIAEADTIIRATQAAQYFPNTRYVITGKSKLMRCAWSTNRQGALLITAASLLQLPTSTFSELWQTFNQRYLIASIPWCFPDSTDAVL